MEGPAAGLLASAARRRAVIDIPRQRPRHRSQSQLFMVLVAVACGVAGALAAVVFRTLIRIFTGLFFEGAEGVTAVIEEGWLAEAHDPLEVARALPWYWKVAIPAMGGMLVGPLIWFFAREAKGHGVPEVMEAVALRSGVIRGRVVAVKTLASALTIGSGGSVGREGPIVQIASAVGSGIGQLLRVTPRQLRTIVGCGAAAGISATFNAPIAGALFAVEVIVGDFAVAQFSPIVISSVVATVLSRYFLGDHPAFEVPTYELVAPFELLPYMAVGAVAGLVGLLFMSVLYFFEDSFDRLRFPEWGKPVMGGVVVGCIGIAFPNVFGVGYSSIGPALEGSLEPALLGALLVAKLLATAVTIGSGGSGGIFAPSLFLGAMTGGFLGSLIHMAFPGATAESGAYALVTMGAVVAATTHAPITAIIMIFEMTQSITIIPPLMAACVVSTLVSQFVRKESIYTMKLVRRGVDLGKQEDPNVLKRLLVRDVMDPDVATIQAHARFEEVLHLVVQSQHVEFFVVDRDQRLLGDISLSEVRRLLMDQEALTNVVVAGDLVGRTPPTVTPDDDLDTVMQILGHADLEEIAVVDPEDSHKLIGTVTSQHAIDAYNAEVMRRDLAGGVSSRVGTSGRVRQAELGGGYVIQELDAPLRFHGRNLRELDVRVRHGVQVVLIRSPLEPDPARRVRVPSSTDRIREGDTLIVAGPKEAVDALLHH
ncbi:MAG: chloride channel protein [Deltaproteobacteria bacterium]|nr:chloride channel protein [Deltaproteobacteria bacterium]